MDHLLEQMDETVLNIFQVLDDLYEKQACLSQAMKDGFLHLSRARYSIGVKRIEANLFLDANLVANRTVQIDSDDIDNLSSLESSDGGSEVDQQFVQRHLIELKHHQPTKKNSNEKPTSAESAETSESETLLRKRVTNKAGDSKSKEKDTDSPGKSKTSTEHNQGDFGTEGLEESEENAERKVTNPIKLFGILVPQPLRFSQKSFESAVQLSVEIADLKLKLALLQNQMKTLKKRKLKLGGDDVDAKKAISNEA